MHIFLSLATATLLLTAPLARAEVDPGNYLAARHAVAANDFAKAAEYATRALLSDPRNVVLMSDAVSAYIGIGRFDRALPIAERLAKADPGHQLADLVRLVQTAQGADWPGLLELQTAGLTVAPMVDQLSAGWARIGAGRMAEGLAEFDKVAERTPTRAFGLYHKALALALAGDLEAADDILAGRGNEPLNPSRRVLMLRIEILSQLERNAEALELMQAAFGADPDPVLRKAEADLRAGVTLPLTMVRSAGDGMAEVFHTVALALQDDAPDDFVLAFSRAAEALNPDHFDTLLLSARLLERIGRNDLAIAAYDRVPAESPYYHVAEMGRAAALASSGDPDAGIEVLQRLSESHDTIAGVFVALGDAQRREDRYGEAGLAYDRAIALLGEPVERHWLVYFSRGITQEREKHWDRAEADFRMALKLRPDEPRVLNYLGYSFVEMQQNLDEALDMIQRAVAARPEDGYITDSLGWVLYRLGRYDDAVRAMERAASLQPIDPVINDHLGDVYWAVGRKREAEFQWRRAMSYDPEEADLQRIRRKLEVGLDAVLQEEGAEPLAVARDG